MKTVDYDFAKWTHWINKRVSAAIGSSCDLVVRETRRVLNKTGPNKALQRAFGIDPLSGPHKQPAGVSAIMDLKEIKFQKGVVFWGGTWTDTQGTAHKGIYWYGEPLNKWVQASPVGQPPHKQTGTLQKSIQRELNRSASGDVVSGRVGPLDELVYARRHELGGPGKYPARPYLLPTFEKLRRTIEEKLKAAVYGRPR